MKLIIDVPEEVYEALKSITEDATSLDPYSLADIIVNKSKPDRPQGEWKRHDEWRNGEYIGGFYHVNCPCEDGYYSKWETNFCPNCGAEMRNVKA